MAPAPPPRTAVVGPGAIGTTVAAALHEPLAVRTSPTSADPLVGWLISVLGLVFVAGCVEGFLDQAGFFPWWWNTAGLLVVRAAGAAVASALLPSVSALLAWGAVPRGPRSGCRSRATRDRPGRDSPDALTTSTPQADRGDRRSTAFCHVGAQGRTRTGDEPQAPAVTADAGHRPLVDITSIIGV